jgi:hypothetical protein
LILGGVLAMLYLGNVAAARIAGPDDGLCETEGIERLWRPLAAVAGAVALAIVVLLASHAFRAGPRSQGIIERTPWERYPRMTEPRTGPESAAPRAQSAR